MISRKQADLFEAPIFHDVVKIREWLQNPPLFIIGCSSKKKTEAAPAKLLYKSKRFELAVKLAAKIGAEFRILSGEHGLVEADQILSPYDTKIDNLTDKKKNILKKKIASQISKTTNSICLLTNSEYSNFFDASFGSKNKPDIFKPLKNIEERFHEAWVIQAFKYACRISELHKFYEVVRIQRQSGKLFRLKEFPEINLPAKGVYIFLDENEPNFQGIEPRVVRIGTHAISVGSKSSLRSRVRNHYGQANGTGNHRGSIFRLHCKSSAPNRQIDLVA